ncbi:MAG TPA: hypothetical protein PL112_03730, partial [Candidatus Obscuribacter sp.]|nr:hypothetical protein [Candidatus Obscuribacter sp.]
PLSSEFPSIDSSLKIRLQNKMPAVSPKLWSFPASVLLSGSASRGLEALKFKESGLACGIRMDVKGKI